MEKFCIVTNKVKDKDLSVTMHIKEYLEQRGKTCVIASEKKEEDPLLLKKVHLSIIP